MSTPLARVTTIFCVISSCSVHRQPIVHIDLNADQQVVAHLQDRNPFHR